MEKPRMLMGPAFESVGYASTGEGNLDIANTTIGASKEGLTTYLENLHTAMFDDVINEINDYAEITSALNNCWQGASRARFDEMFAKMRDEVAEDLQAEYQDLQYRLEELQQSYFLQDANMITE